jgi:integrase
MTIRLPGVKAYWSKGSVYYYLRSTGERIVDVAGKPLDPAVDLYSFVKRVEEMNSALLPAPVKHTTKPTTLLELVERFCGSSQVEAVSSKRCSLEWSRLSPATRLSYWRILDPEKGYLARSLPLSLGRIMLSAIDTPNVVLMRDSVRRYAIRRLEGEHARRGGCGRDPKRAPPAWAASYTVRVLRRLFGWAVLYGYMPTNPALGVPEFPRPNALPEQHRSWTDAEFEAMLNAAHASGATGIVLALALARFAGWPLGDIANQPPSVWQRPRLIYTRKKTGRTISVLAADPLLPLLDRYARQTGPRLVTDPRGTPYSEARLRQAVYRLSHRLAVAGRVKVGLTVHGLRHSLGKELYDLGLEREARKAMLGHESDAASRVYERDGERKEQADRAVEALNRHHLKSPVEPLRLEK